MRIIPERLTEAMVLKSIVHSLERKLGGVFLRGTVPRDGAVLAASHSSWWDGFVLGALAYDCGRRATIMMSIAQLDTHPFLAQVGAVPTSAVPQMIGDAAAGKLVVVFPEGGVQAGRELGPLHRGAARIAREAGVPLVPVAVRVRLRGRERPEAFLMIGEPVDVQGQESTLLKGEASAAAADLTAHLATALDANLRVLDTLLDSNDPEGPLPRFTQLHALNHTNRKRDYASMALRALTCPKRARPTEARRRTAQPRSQK